MVEPWIVELKERFDFNLDRVRAIVDAYERLGTPGSGRTSVRQTDLLRAAVVFLHAALEDVLRSTAEERLPYASPDALEGIPLPAPGPPKPQVKFTLKELAAYRGEQVCSVIRHSVAAYLRYSNYNNTTEVANLLIQLGVTEADKQRFLDLYGGGISSMMSRRHLIVHRADRNPVVGRGQHPAASIRRETVLHWVDVVRRFGHKLLRHFSGS